MSARVERIKEWMSKPGRMGRSPEGWMDDYGERLVTEGLPVWRMATVLSAHDPQLSATHLIWRRGEKAFAVARSWQVLQTTTYLGTPVQRALEQGLETDCRLDAEAVARFPVLEELRAAGGTGYYICPVDGSEALSHSNAPTSLSARFAGRGWISYATDKPGGFSAEELSDLRALRDLVSLRISLETSKHSARSLLRAYLGPNASERVLDGAFQRGSGQLIDAVIWYCDMRGFTAMSDARSPLQVVSLLDRYFDAVATPIERQGGEVLKFIGDAVLGIFPLAGDPRSATARALEATHEAIDRLAKLNEQLRAEHEPELGLGAALHVGSVVYGNIGASSRLDFTVIGAAVNEVCRIEPLTRTLGCDALLSDAFVRAAEIPAPRSLGRHELKGVGGAREVFALPARRAASTP